MPDHALPVTTMFEKLVDAGHLKPMSTDVPRQLPGAFRAMPSITGYTTPEAPIRPEAESNAKLGQRPSRNSE